MCDRASSAEPSTTSMTQRPTKEDVDEGMDGEGNDGGGAGDDATEVIAGCREDVRALWEDGVVQEMLARQRIRLADSAGL